MKSSSVSLDFMRFDISGWLSLIVNVTGIASPWHDVNFRNSLLSIPVMLPSRRIPFRSTINSEL